MKSTNKNSIIQESENAEELLDDDSFDKIYLEDLSNEVLEKFKHLEQTTQDIQKKQNLNKKYFNNITDDLESRLNKSLQVLN